MEIEEERPIKLLIILKLVDVQKELVEMEGKANNVAVNGNHFILQVHIERTWSLCVGRVLIFLILLLVQVSI